MNQKKHQQKILHLSLQRMKEENLRLKVPKRQMRRLQIQDSRRRAQPL